MIISTLCSTIHSYSHIYSNERREKEKTRKEWVHFICYLLHSSHWGSSGAEILLKSCCTSLLATVTTTLINTTLYRVLGWQAGKWICILFPWLTAVCRNRINLCFLLSVMTQKSTCVTFNRWNEITTFVSLPLPKFYMKLDYLSSRIITQILRSVRVSRCHSPSLKRSEK